MHDSVTVHVAASPAAIWDLVSDVTKIGRYSPETFEAEWLNGATGPAVGATFRGHVKRNGRGPVYWTTCTVLECVPEREFGFGVGSSEKPLNVWRYRLEPVGTGGVPDVSLEGRGAELLNALRQLAEPGEGKSKGVDKGEVDDSVSSGSPGLQGGVVLQCSSVDVGSSGP